MMRSLACTTTLFCLGAGLSATPTSAQPVVSAAMDHSIRQLQESHGAWDVTTKFFKPDGSVAIAAAGTYNFEWVIKDRLLRGVSEIPELDNRSAILFYVSESKGFIEMVSVGKDGHLWVMTGPAGSEVRTTSDVAMSDGSKMRLRFTRYNVTPDRFESKMEVSTDGGVTWTPGNHQVFLRRR